MMLHIKALGLVVSDKIFFMFSLSYLLDSALWSHGHNLIELV